MTTLKLLAIETSSGTGTLALGIGDEVAEQTIATPREQTPRILAIIDELLAEGGIKVADLDAVVFGRGPGSFTGLRVAAAVAQGLSFASGVPIVSVSSLAALAQRGIDEHAASRVATDGRANPDSRADPVANADTNVDASSDANADATRVLCCVDARMGEVYWGTFRSVAGEAGADSEEQLGPPSAVARPEGAFIALGDGFEAFADDLSKVIAAAAHVDSAAVPGAAELLRLGAADVAAGRFVPLEAALPVYLRTSEAWKK